MINSTNNTATTLAADVKHLNDIRTASKQNSPDALKAAAKQFEALFMNMMLKSMREATPQDGMFESEQTKMYTSMLDQQMTQSLSNRGVGLADMLIRQLSNRVDMQPDLIEQPAGALNTDAPVSTGKFNSSQSDHVKAFQARFSAEADEASRTTGIPAKFMLGQAALETGWGKREIKAADGTSSNNLFGIKATGGWKGKVVEAPTTEYVNGVPETRMEKFRAYDSHAESFRDYAKLLSTNPRYENVLANASDATSFAHGLQRAGYATDPHYAAKLSRIINHSLST